MGEKLSALNLKKRVSGEQQKLVGVSWMRENSAQGANTLGLETEAEAFVFNHQG